MYSSSRGRGAFCFAYSPRRTPTLFLPRIWASCLSVEAGRRAGRRCRPGPGRGFLPSPSLERTFDGYESPEKYFASSPTDDDDGSKGGTRQGGAAPICKQICAMAQPLPPSFIKMNCSGVGKRVYRTRITPLIPQLPISSAHAPFMTGIETRGAALTQRLICGRWKDGSDGSRLRFVRNRGRLNDPPIDPHPRSCQY